MLPFGVLSFFFPHPDEAGQKVGVFFQEAPAQVVDVVGGQLPRGRASGTV